jgi:hypothetical protein
MDKGRRNIFPLRCCQPIGTGRALASRLLESAGPLTSIASHSGERQGRGRDREGQSADAKCRSRAWVKYLALTPAVFHNDIRCNHTLEKVSIPTFTVVSMHIDEDPARSATSRRFASAPKTIPPLGCALKFAGIRALTYHSLNELLRLLSQC